MFGHDDGSDLELGLPTAADSSRSRKMMKRTPEPAARRKELRRHTEVELEPDMRILLATIKEVKSEVQVNEVSIQNEL